MLRVKFGQRSRYFDSHVTVQRCTTIAAVQDEHSLLPPRSREFEGRGTLVLDLDETLVYIKCEQGCLVNCQCGEGDGFYVAKRPCVDDFLQLMAANFEVVLWTASPQPYAEAALELLDPEGWIFAHKLYR
ncbi:probable phosphatase PSR2 [Selaginella moellendorffii]|uniref:probable phosphatase PSR2 n=1 Tax=Selaginella moellendorffii TaxID=88036 RepID=UPI000D1CB193|nr:probable phosphatase PSR2 [Selaginella moellendorffii]|eukprot:XP_024514884.1 probable phosphatase PSR2 [Selaginella moellendorffii]